jgi:C-terminal processing protease CtpA/Prc
LKVFSDFYVRSYKLKKLLVSINKFEPYLIICNILPDSPFMLSENFNIGDIIKKINGIKINTIEQLQSYLLNLSPSEQYITIETSTNIIDTISIKLIKDDIELLKKIEK